MIDKLLNMFGKSKSNQVNPILPNAMTAESMPESVVRMMCKFAYQEAHVNFPEKLFANPVATIEAISKGSTPEYGGWTKRTLKTGKTVYLTKYPDYPIRNGQVQAGVGAVIVDPSDPSKPEYFVMNVALDFGPRVRRAFLNEEGNLCSAQDGPGCENSIEAFFQLLDSGKSGMERQHEEFKKRMESKGIKLNND